MRTQPLSTQLEQITQQSEPIRGEYVIIVAGYQEKKETLTKEQSKILRVLAKHCGTRKAAEITSEITGMSKQLCYRKVIETV